MSRLCQDKNLWYTRLIFYVDSRVRHCIGLVLQNKISLTHKSNKRLKKSGSGDTKE